MNFKDQWSVPVLFWDNDAMIDRLIESTGAAMVFLAKDWRWPDTEEYEFAANECLFGVGGSVSHDDCRAAFLRAIERAGLEVFPEHTAIAVARENEVRRTSRR